MIACIGLVLGFRSSDNMAAAYGIAVTTTMLCTTVLFYFAALRLWHWSPLGAALLCSLFLVVETTFFAANLLKVLNGGWFPLAVGFAIFLLMATWKKGRQLLWNKLRPASMPLETFLDGIQASTRLTRVPGTALFMAANPDGTPMALLHNLKHNKVLHERNVILTIITDEVPQVNPEKRLEIEKLAAGILPYHRPLWVHGGTERPRIARRRSARRTAPGPEQYHVLPKPRERPSQQLDFHGPLAPMALLGHVAKRPIRRLILSHSSQPCR